MLKKILTRCIECKKYVIPLWLPRHSSMALPVSHYVLQSPSNHHNSRDSEVACFVRSFATLLCVGRSARHLLQKQGIFGHNSTIIVFQSNQRPFFCASSYHRRNKIWESLFISALDKTSFEGVTGPVRFKGNSRRGNIVIKQIVRK